MRGTYIINGQPYRNTITEAAHDYILRRVFLSSSRYPEWVPDALYPQPVKLYLGLTTKTDIDWSQTNLSMAQLIGETGSFEFTSYIQSTRPAWIVQEAGSDQIEYVSNGQAIIPIQASVAASITGVFLTPEPTKNTMGPVFSYLSFTFDLTTTAPNNILEILYRVGVI